MHLIADAADIEDDEILAVGIDQALELADHVVNSDMTTISPSCPALCRASTSFFADAPDVDGRDEPGHDG
jgi:hypothetical protein